MKLHKIVFFSSMIMGTMVAISSYSWMSMWMGLEINLLSIIPLFYDKNNSTSSESSLKYFITQALASLVILMAAIMMLMTNEFINPMMDFSFSLMMNTALLTKLGAAPFHFWLPEVSEGLSWYNVMILLTWQKIAPSVLIMNNKINIQFMMMIIIISLVISTISGFNQMSLRKIMAYSSINHIAWMLSSMMISTTMWTIYFAIYSIINLNIIMILDSTKTFYMNQINNILTQNKLTKMIFMMNFLSLGGLPPFIGFLPKWLVINWLTNSSMMLITFIMIVTTLIMLFIYTRVIMTSLVISITENKNLSFKIKTMPMVLINMITLLGLVMCTLMLNFL